MRKYLTPQNIAIAVLSIAVIVLIVILSQPKPKVVDNSAAVGILRAQLEQAQIQNAQLKKEGEESRKADSVRLANYEARIWKDHQTIQQLKAKRDEKITRIDSPSFDSDSIRGAFSDF